LALGTSSDCRTSQAHADGDAVPAAQLEDAIAEIIQLFSKGPERDAG
jgi:hypothetical protein